VLPGPSLDSHGWTHRLVWLLAPKCDSRVARYVRGALAVWSARPTLAWAGRRLRTRARAGAPTRRDDARRVRYNKDEIYTNIVNILVAINPYKSLQIYSPQKSKTYTGERPRTGAPAWTHVRPRVLLRAARSRRAFLAGAPGPARICRRRVGLSAPRGQAQEPGTRSRSLARFARPARRFQACAPR
jgi:hypothetical protein